DLFHACWKHLLDVEFIYAYHHGIVLQCPDGVYGRVFPCIFTYSANYPEKILIATIKDMGSCPCPRCLLMKASFDLLLSSKLIPSGILSIFNQNAFVEKLGPLGFNVFHMLIVDFMHKCKLGTWKALFTHLIHLLYALPGGDHLVATLDNRFHHISSYGHGVIHKFANNTSEMKRLTAQDFEDILQVCSIGSVIDMFAQWHMLTKLRLHSETTLTVLDEMFKKLTRQLQKFQDFTCVAFITLELPKEKMLMSIRPPMNTQGKKFNMNTYKFHAMGDHLHSIQLFRTMDSFTLQI
ncbi:hypothetical protein BDR06DRAFT_864585, partial [Suillus hirtellus]